MNWLLDVLPDWGWRTGFEALRDLLSLGMAGLGAYLAWSAIKVGRDQARIGREQTEIAKRQEALDIEQAQITKRQGEIAEKQDRLMDEQLRKKEELELRVVASDMLARWQFRVLNTGQKAAAGFYWQIRLSKKNSDLVEIISSDNGQLESAREYDHQGTPFICWSGYFEKPTYPGCEVTCAYIGGNTTNFRKLDEDVYVMWNVSSDSGIFPKSQGFGVLFFKPLDDVKQQVGLDPVWWTSFERQLRCPQWQKREAGAPAGGSRMNSSSKPSA